MGSLTRCVAKRLLFVGFELDSRYHRLCNLDFSQDMSADVPSHSTSDSRDKLHLTRRHHPIHAQNFTIKPPSTAQAPCSCLASTCGDVSSRPPFLFFRHGRSHFHNFAVLIVVFVPDVSTRPGSSFFKNWPDVTTRPPFCL